MTQDLFRRFPSVDDLARRAKARVPHFAWEFLDSGTGRDISATRNQRAFDQVTLLPQFMKGPLTPDLTTRLFDVDYQRPFGVAPVGMSGLIWPDCEAILARAAGARGFPYAMSTAASAMPEIIGPMTNGMGWFQLYPPRSANMRLDLLERVREAGFRTLLLTVDVPVISRRERQMRAGVSSAAGISLPMLWQSMRRPAWSLATWRTGQPRMLGLQKYADSGDMNQFLAFVSQELNGTLDWEYVKTVRDEWDGPLVLKGILDPVDAEQAIRLGVDGILVSNHGGRQLDAAPAAIEQLPAVAAAVRGRAPVLFDSGVRSGLDVARAIALGADFVLLGRAFMYGVAALGERGGAHVADVLSADLENVLGQLGCKNPLELRSRIGAG